MSTPPLLAILKMTNHCPSNLHWFLRSWFREKWQQYKHLLFAFHCVRRIRSLFRFTKKDENVFVPMLIFEVFPQQCVLEEGMHGDCYHSREMQYKWSSLAMKESAQGKHGFVLHNFAALFCFVRHNCFYWFETWLSVCLHVDILFCHFTNHNRHKTPKIQRKTTNSHALNVSTDSDNGESADVNIYILHYVAQGSRLQHGRYQQAAAAPLTLPLSLCLLSFNLCFLLTVTIFIRVKSTSVVGIRKLKIEHILSVCSWLSWEI